MGMPLVFEAMTEPGLRNFSTFSKRRRLMSRFSTTASMTRSHSLRRGRASSKLPGGTGPARAPARRKEGGGLRLLRRFEPRARDAVAHLLRFERQTAGVLLGRRLPWDDVEQQRGDARVGEVGGDLRAHRARAQNGGLFDPKHKGFSTPRLSENSLTGRPHHTE